MRGTPRSVMLTYANAVAGWWLSAAASAAERQQRAALRAALGLPASKPRKSRAKTRRLKS